MDDDFKAVGGAVELEFLDETAEVGAPEDEDRERDDDESEGGRGFA